MVLIRKLAWLACAGPSALAWAQDAPPDAELRWRYEGPRLQVTVTARTPDQVAAFYEARKFPRPMIDLLRGQCFLTVGIHNRGREVAWLELDRWRFEGEASGEIRRRDRDWLAARLDDLEAPRPSRATLRWTLLPERLDFRPDEAEGGNVLLPPQTGPFALQAPFALGADRRAGEIVVRLENLRCGGTSR